MLPQAGSFPDGDDHTDEERKLINETRKILGDQEIADLRHLRARAGRDRPLRGGQRRDEGAAQPASAPASCSPRRPA